MTSRWERTVDAFVQKHSSLLSPSDDDERKKKDILLIVNPNSGGGNAMKLFETCVLGEVQATGRPVDVYVTKSSDDVKELASTKSDYLKSFKAIVILAGDSTLYEMIQAPLMKRMESDSDEKEKWPFAPILHLPGGSANVIAKENFGRKATVKQMIRDALSIPSTNASTSRRNTGVEIKSASLIKVSSATSVTPPRFAFQVCGTGMFLRMISFVEARRKDVYPILGLPGMMLSILSYILGFMRVDDLNPTFLSVINSDTEHDGDMEFDISRFDDNMMVIHVPKDKNPGKRALFSNVFMKLTGGELAKEWKEHKTPDYVAVEKPKRLVYKNPTPGQEMKFICDGTCELPFETKDNEIIFQTVPHAVPMFVAKNKNEKGEDDEWDVQVAYQLTNCRSIRDAYEKLASPTTYQTWNKAEMVGGNSEKSSTNIIVELPSGVQEPLPTGANCVFTVNVGLGVKITSTMDVVESTQDENECVFHARGISMHEWIINESRTTICKTGIRVGNDDEDGAAAVDTYWAVVQEKFVAGGWVAKSHDNHMRLQHTKMLAGLNESLLLPK